MLLLSPGWRSHVSRDVFERDIENPKESEIFASYPGKILADAMMLDFIVDYLRLIISGNMNTFEIEALMDEEIETTRANPKCRPTAWRWWATRFRRSGIVAR